MKKILKVVSMAFALVVFVSACSDNDNNDTSSGSGSSTVEGDVSIVNSETGEVINVSFSAMTAAINEVITISYTLKDQSGNETSGTIDWDDNSTDRIAGTSTVKHIFRNSGLYRVTVQLDGAEKMIVGSLNITDEVPAAPMTGQFSSNISRGANPSRVCLVSDTGDFNVAAAGFSFMPDPGNGVPFIATLAINGSQVSSVSGVTDDDGGVEDTFVFARFKGNASGATFGDPVEYTFSVDGYGTSSGMSRLNDCRNCAGSGNPSTSCVPQAIF